MRDLVPASTLFRCVLVLALLCMTASAGAADPSPARIWLPDDQVSFASPAGFTPLDAQWLAVKYPRGNAPRHAVGNERRTTTIAYDVLDGTAPTSDLEELRRAFVAGLAQAPKVRWIANEIRSLGPDKWVYVECTTAAPDTDIRNILLLTVVRNRIVLFNFNATVEDFGRIEPALRASIDSIKVAPRS